MIPEYDWRKGDESWTGFTSANDQQLELEGYNQFGGSWIGPHNACPKGKVARLYWLDFLFPRGLGKVVGDQIENHTVRIQVRYRDEGGEEWTVIPYSWTLATNDQKGFTVPIDTGSAINAVFQYRRTNRESDELAVRDTIQLVRLKCELPANESYANITAMALKMRGTNAISSSAEQRVNLIGNRKHWSVQDYINLLNGTPLPEEHTDPYPGSANVNAILATKFPLSSINLEEMRDFDAKCKAAGQTYNDEIEKQTTLGQFQKICLNVGYGDPVVVGGKMSVRREDPTNDFGHLYTPFNTTGEIKREDKFYADSDYDAIEVEYFPTDSAKPKTVICTAPGYTATNPKQMRLRGANDVTHAWRWGMRHYEDLKFKPTQFRWPTEQDGFNSEYLSVAQLSDALTGGVQGFVSGYKNRVLDLVQKVEFTQDLMYIVVGHPDGRAGKWFLCTKGEGLRQVILNEPLDFEPVFDGTRELPRFAFGGIDTLTEKTIVRKVIPSGTNKVKLTAIQYYSKRYRNDNAFPPETN